MNQKLKTVLILSPLVLVLDQLTKWFVVKNIPYGGLVEVIPRFFDLVHYRNKGAAFGFLSQWDSAYRDIFFYVLAVFAILFLFSFLKQIPEDNKKAIIPVALIFGGAMGNIIDRIFRGSVVDFLLVHWDNRHVSWSVAGWSLDFDLVWPAFNVADSAISVSVIWLFIVMTIVPKKEA